MPSSAESWLPDRSIQIAIDRGGTFADCHASWPRREGEGREEHILKLLSKHDAYQDAPREAVRRMLEHIYGREIPRSERMSTDKIDWIRLSTTVGTNALLERQGARHALLITKGFRDLLVIGNQARPKIFALNIERPEVLYERVVEVDERVTLVGYAQDPKRAERAVQFDDDGKITRPYDVKGGKRAPEAEGEIVRGVSGEAVRILRRPDLEQVERDLREIYDSGIRSLAVLFIHSYTYGEHERLVGDLARKIGFQHVSLSHRISGMIKAVPRGTSATCDAYLTPILQEYIDSFFDGFDESLRKGVDALQDAGADDDTAKHATRVEFMTSDGGLTDVKTFSGLKSILSGPAGGVVGCALTSWDDERKTPVIGLDMGGTSSDVSRYDGSYETVFETTTAGVTVQSPQLDINTVAAGGGSRLFFRNGLFAVGPESAGASPGPSCYRKGGPVAITDANLVLGRLVVEHFPKIFGKSEDQSLDVEASRTALRSLEKEINAQSSGSKTTDEIAWGFIKVANETMARPIRALTEARGYSTSKHILSCFGGAAGQHACSVASLLGIKTVLIHRYSSVLSAYGMALADRAYEQQEPSSETLTDDDAVAKLRKRLDVLSDRVRSSLQSQGFKSDRIVVERYLNLRFEGTDTALMTLEQDGKSFEAAFVEQYKQEFGFVLDDKAIVVDDVRVRGVGKTWDSLGPSVFAEADSTEFRDLDVTERGDGSTSVYFEQVGRVDAPIFLSDKLRTGDQLRGPALLVDGTSTIVIDPDALCRITSRHFLITLS